MNAINDFTEQLMDAVDAMKCQAIANQTGRKVYVHALFGKHNRRMTTRPTTTIYKPLTNTNENLVQVVILAATPER